MSIDGSREDGPGRVGPGAHVAFGALAALRTAHVCSVCGYGISVAGRLPTCPMCGGDAWQPDPHGVREAARHRSLA